MTYLPGPGDPATWGPPTGHPADPRTPDPDECPDCGEAMIDADGCAACGWTYPEPDYEAMAAGDPEPPPGWEP